MVLEGNVMVRGRSEREREGVGYSTGVDRGGGPEHLFVLKHHHKRVPHLLPSPLRVEGERRTGEWP